MENASKNKDETKGKKKNMIKHVEFVSDVSLNPNVFDLQ